MARNMITCDAVDSLYRHTHFRRGPDGLTEVEQNERGSVLSLHANPIAFLEYSHKGGRLYICDGGWKSRTTKERLNGLPGVNVHRSKFVFYLNNKEWDGSWACVNPHEVKWDRVWRAEHPGFVLAHDAQRPQAAFFGA